MLAIPALNLEVFWLKANKAGLADFVFPFPSASTRHAFLTSVTGPLEMTKFLAAISPLAAALLNMPPGYGA
jgi:hypothetical protein